MKFTDVRTTLFVRFASAPVRRVLLASGGALAALFVALPASAAQASSSRVSTECPSDMSHVGRTCVDKWEASLVEKLPDGEEVPFSPYAPPNGRNVRAVSQPSVIPQAHISMVEAQRACKASGKRLCHASEWKNACKGPEKTQYPYGDQHLANACVDTGRTSPVRKLHGGVYNSKNMNDPMLNQLPNTVEPTGTTATCTNSYGVYDMVGNVHEWVDDGAFHGGYYLDTKINREGCDYNTTAHAKSYYDYSTGFRCCADEGTVPEEEDQKKSPSHLEGVAMNESVERAADLPKVAHDPQPLLTRRTAMGDRERDDGDRRSFEASTVQERANRPSFYG